MNVNKNSQVSNAFYSRYHMKILTDILDVMTDGFHKSGLDVQTKIFYILIHSTAQNIVFYSLFRSTTRSLPKNQPIRQTPNTSMPFWSTGWQALFLT
jgi:hypothetical protein